MPTGHGALTVRIEPWADSDRALLDELLGTYEMTAHLGGPESSQQLDERHARYRREGSRQYKVLVETVENGVGWVGYWEREWRGEQVWETGWAVIPALQGRGVGSAAMRLLLGVIAGEPVSRPVHAFPSVDNGASNALCRKVGFTLLDSADFEYPPGHVMRCNDWRLDLAGE